eukprot:5992300-Prymnesium_polylepis.2
MTLVRPDNQEQNGGRCGASEGSRGKAEGGDDESGAKWVDGGQVNALGASDGGAEDDDSAHCERELS